MSDEDLDTLVPCTPPGGGTAPSLGPEPRFGDQSRRPQNAGEREVSPGQPPIIDSPQDIPGRFWAPESAGFIRRSAASAVDVALLAVLLGLFLGGASLGLAREGVDTSALCSSPGLQGALIPLALLAVFLSLVYHVAFDALAGRTPGKRLVGLEVRSPDGSAPTWGKAALRWCGGALGLVCGGVGVVWAFFEPRRRGWADLLSNTVVAERAPEEIPGPR